MKTENQLYDDLIYKFGRRAQLEKAVEELDELKAELQKVLQCEGHIDQRTVSDQLRRRVTEEAVDVDITLRQVIRMLCAGGEYDRCRALKLKELRNWVDSLPPNHKMNEGGER